MILVPQNVHYDEVHVQQRCGETLIVFELSSVHNLNVEFKRISLTGFRSCTKPCFVNPNELSSQSRQHGKSEYEFQVLETWGAPYQNGIDVIHIIKHNRHHDCQKKKHDDEIKKKDEEVEKEKEVAEIVKETNVDDTSAKKNEEVVTEKEVVDMSGSQEIRKEQMQTPIPSPIRSHRNDLSSDKTISEELVDTVTPTTATSSKTPSTTTRQKKSFTLKTRRLPGSIAGMCRRRGLIRSHIKTKFITREIFVEKIKEVIQHCDNIVLELTVTTTNEMLKKEMPRLVKLAVNKDREVSPVDISGMVSKEFAAHGPKLIEELFRKHMQNTTLNLYPKTKSSTATTSSADLQQQLYLSMKTKPQDQAADPEIWEILKAKFEKP
ncbi:hypothetical protein Tco_1320728 [Tanacetum coccineum]